MADITFTLSKKDMKNLLEHVFLGNWILRATKDDEDKEEDDFIQRIYSMMKNYNIEEDIDYDKESNKYFIGQEKEEDYMEKVEEYNRDTFIEELIENLTARDIEEKYTKEQLEEFDENEFNDKFHKEAEKYFNEVNKNGIKHIGIVKK